MQPHPGGYSNARFWPIAIYMAATDQTAAPPYANSVIARNLTPAPADLLKQGVDGLNVLQEFGWLGYRTLLAGRM